MLAGTSNSVIVSESTTSLATRISGGGWGKVDLVVDEAALKMSAKLGRLRRQRSCGLSPLVSGRLTEHGGLGTISM